MRVVVRHENCVTVSCRAPFESPASIDVSVDAGTLVLRLCGELDLASRGDIEPPVLAAIATAPCVILDLTDLTFCDSNGITMFVTAHEKAEAQGATLAFRNLYAAVARVFAMSGVDQLFDISK